MTRISELERTLVSSVIVRMLVDRRKSEGMTVADVAAYMGVGIREITEFEQSHDPHMFFTMNYARAVGMNIALNLEGE